MSIALTILGIAEKRNGHTLNLISDVGREIMKVQLDCLMFELALRSLV